MFPSMLEHALLQMIWQVVFDDECAFDNALGPSVRSCKLGQRGSLLKWTTLACVAVAMAVVLCLLHGIDLVCYGLNVLGLVWGNLLNALVLPVNVLPVGHSRLVFAFV